MAGILSSLFSSRWTLSDLMNVDIGRQQKSSGCRVFLQGAWPEVQSEGIIDKFKRYFTRNKSVMNVAYIIFKFQVISETGSTYDVFIRTQYDPSGALYMGNIAQVYCGCPDFKFKSAWTLEQHRSLFRSDRLDTELGPAITNAPKRKPGTVLCKHAYAAVMYLINNYTSLMGNV